MPRPSPNHGTQRLPNDDDDDYRVQLYINLVPRLQFIENENTIYLYYYRRRARVCVCVCVCVRVHVRLQNWTNFCPYALISTQNVL